MVHPAIVGLAQTAQMPDTRSGVTNAKGPQLRPLSDVA